MARKLTDKQRAFVEAYLECWNGAEAARRAGYSERSIYVIASENLSNPNIRAEIERRLSEMAMSANEVLARLTDQARADLTAFVSFDDKGQPYIDLQRARRLGKMHLVKRLWHDRNGRLRIELGDPLQALALLGRYHKLFTENVDVTSGGRPLREYADVTDDELEAIRGALKGQAEGGGAT